VRLAEPLGIKLLAPRKKITVMLIGNHSAGKSSFINWWEFLLYSLYFYYMPVEKGKQQKYKAADFFFKLRFEEVRW
jgi:hypothetical protein